MKSIDVKKIGTFVASTAMLGAALAAPVSAAADMTGVDKGFFYDANFNPIVQIVVGEKGMASDAVAAGNIAATIGNLAYMQKTETFTPTYEPQGQVVIETSAIGATGDYVQDDVPEEAGNVTLTAQFFDKDDGFYFPGTNKTYERGDFTQYALACEQQTRTEAGILLEGTYNNIHCLFCKTLCVEGLKNPAHEMQEKIFVDNSKIRYYEEGLGEDDSEALKMALEKNAIKYIVEVGYIPLEDMDVSTSSTEKFADFEYRGKIIFMGKEYYVKDIESDKIYLAEGKVLDDITSEGYTSEFKGYKFKIDHLIYSGEYEVAGILLDVEKPDGTIVQTQISKMANGVVDDLEIAGVYAEAAGAVETASIIVYDTASQVVLEDDKDLELGGVEYDGWKVEWDSFKGACNESDTYNDDMDDCDISAYEGTTQSTYDVLAKIEVTYEDELKDADALEKDESLNFPSEFMLTFKGYMTSGFKEAECSGDGEGDIKLDRGDDVYQMTLSFTGDDGNRYDEVRLDEGPFAEGDQFIMGGTVWEFEKTDSDEGATTKEDTVDVTRKPLISGSKDKTTLTRFCDEDAAGPSTAAECLAHGAGGTPVCSCTGVGNINIRKIALLDAMDDTDNTDYENDDDIEVDPTKLFWANDTYGSFNGIVWYDDSINAIIYGEDAADFSATVSTEMVGTLTGVFDTDNALTMTLMRECNFTADPNATLVYDRNCDYNQDSPVSGLSGNDDDLLVIFTASDDSATEAAVVDMTDRGYTETITYKYKNRLTLYGNTVVANNTTNKANEVVFLDEDIDTTLITPFVGQTYSVDWGVDNKIDSVAVCHPKKAVDATYFLGVGEEETTVEDTVTKDDEGKEITAGCCTFKVKEFSVDVGDTTSQTFTTSTVNKVIGRMVVAEVGADTTKNLVIVGGPVVNGMCTVTTEEIQAEADKFVVKKDGNLLIVAGYEYEETLAAGDALVDWLNANVHA